MECEKIAGLRRTGHLFYVKEQKMLYKMKSNYKNIKKLECRKKTCQARVNLLENGTCELAKKYVEHNHDNEKKSYVEIIALNDMKQNCSSIGGVLGVESNATSCIRSAFRNTCER